MDGYKCSSWYQLYLSLSCHFQCIGAWSCHLVNMVVTELLAKSLYFHATSLYGGDIFALTQYTLKTYMKKLTKKFFKYITKINMCKLILQKTTTKNIRDIFGIYQKYICGEIKKNDLKNQCNRGKVVNLTVRKRSCERTAMVYCDQLWQAWGKPGILMGEAGAKPWFNDKEWNT